MTDNWYDTAQICVKGHVINPESVASPMHNKRFCDSCGSVTITACPACTAPIRGVFHGGVGAAPAASYTAPAFCHNCGRPFPWGK